MLTHWITGKKWQSVLRIWALILLCIKDMAGLLVPQKADELVRTLKEATSLPIDLHTHYTSGVASMTYLKAVEAGCDIIDTAISPFALGNQSAGNRSYG